MQKTVSKNRQYPKNDKFLKTAKIGHFAKALALAKWSLWGENLNWQKNGKKAVEAE